MKTWEEFKSDKSQTIYNGCIISQEEYKNIQKENDQLKALIVRKDTWINKVPHASHCPRSHLSPHFAKGTICECGKDEAISPTISSSLVEDSKRLDWLYGNVGGPTGGFVKFYNEHSGDVRKAIDAARNSSKPKEMK